MTLVYIISYSINCVCVCVCACVCVHYAGVTTNIAVGIAVVVTGTITFVAGALVGFLPYYCVIKRRSKFILPPTDPKNEEVPATNRNEKIELK